MKLLSELKRRNVLRMAVLYVVAAWLVMQVAEVLIGLGALPESTGQWILVLLAIGFPIALIFSWFFEITPEGLSLEKDVAEGQSITRATGRRMDFVIIAVLSAGLLVFAYDKWWPNEPLERSIAVLPTGRPSYSPFSSSPSSSTACRVLHQGLTLTFLRLGMRFISSAFPERGSQQP